MSDAQAKLKAAWDEMIGMLEAARDGIDQPKYMPAPATDRNLAEGYRYLMGFVHSGVERALHEDPGVHNWLDTTGHPEMFMSLRWAYSDQPEPSDWPEISGKKVKLAELMDHLPKGTKTMTPEERRAEIAVRQRHVLKRYRAL